ncbi:hypothetical protein [Thermococcus sp. CX2]|uniref:hypothetical protein n=1 Tax=Thermococcus sp. CX2 TaxID=163006 RepID=UPI0035303548
MQTHIPKLEREGVVTFNHGVVTLLKIPEDVTLYMEVVLRTPKDLETTFELLDKPILHYIEGEEEVYAIIEGGISYEYRKPLPEEKKKAN